MKKRLLCLLLSVFLLTISCSCTSSALISSVFSDKDSSSFSIHFIDVGQGDATLVECDGQYMLIDGGDKTHGDRVRSILASEEIQHLNILAISHFHNDHIGGLIRVLEYATDIDITIANSDTDVKRQDESDTGEKNTFNNLVHQLYLNGSSIKVPHVGEKFSLGSAEVEVVDVAATDDNDSLVLLITYGKTRFLFTGDIGDEAQTRIADKYENGKDEPFKIDVLKMPHHGSASPNSYNGTGSLYRFIRTFMPDYAVISVGVGNHYGHPHRETLELLEQADVKIYRTDLNGDVTVRSDGKTVAFEATKG